MERNLLGKVLSQTKAPGIHDSWRHLSLPWLAQCKPSGPAQACSGQAKARVDGARSRVYLAPKKVGFSRSQLPWKLAQRLATELGTLFFSFSGVTSLAHMIA